MLKRLRLGLLVEDLAMRFDISVTSEQHLHNMDQTHEQGAFLVDNMAIQISSK